MKKKKYINFISLVIIFLALTILIYIAYKSEIIHKGNIRSYYTKYYILFSLFLFLSIFIYFLRDEVKFKLTIIFLSTFFSLYLLEYFLIFTKLSAEWKSGTRERIIESKKQNKFFDERSKYQFYLDFKKDFPEAVISVGSNSLRDSSENILNFGGIGNRPTVLCNENGFYATYNSDRYGFNNPDSEWGKEEIDYLLIGDSFVQGYCVNQKDTISGNLRSKLDDSGSVISLGVAGIGPLAEYGILREYSKKKIKRIIWIYCGDNDLKDFYNEKKIKTLNKYLNDKNFSQNLVSKQDKIDELLIEKISKNESNYKLRFFKLYNLRTLLFGRWSQIFQNNEELPQFPIQEFDNIFNEVKSYSNDINAKLYFVYLPAHYPYYKNSSQKVKTEFIYYQTILKIIRSHNIPVVDLHEKFFNKQKDPSIFFPFKVPGHLTPEGYKLITNVIYDNIHQYEK